MGVTRGFFCTFLLPATLANLWWMKKNICHTPSQKKMASRDCHALSRVENSMSPVLTFFYICHTWVFFHKYVRCVYINLCLKFWSPRIFFSISKNKKTVDFGKKRRYLRVGHRNRPPQILLATPYIDVFIPCGTQTNFFNEKNRDISHAPPKNPQNIAKCPKMTFFAHHHGPPPPNQCCF